jgi:hypothetical protein
VRCRHGGKEGADPLPRRKKGRPGYGFKRSPIAFEGRKRGQGLVAEFDSADHMRELEAVLVGNHFKSISGVVAETRTRLMRG